MAFRCHKLNLYLDRVVVIICLSATIIIYMYQYVCLIVFCSPFVFILLLEFFRLCHTWGCLKTCCNSAHIPLSGKFLISADSRARKSEQYFIVCWIYVLNLLPGFNGYWLHIWFDYPILLAGYPNSLTGKSDPTFLVSITCCACPSGWLWSKSEKIITTFSQLTSSFCFWSKGWLFELRKKISNGTSVRGTCSHAFASLIWRFFAIISQQRPSSKGTPKYLDSWHVVKETAKWVIIICFNSPTTDP